MNVNAIDAKALKSRIGNWDALLGDLAPELGPALAHKGRHVPCPVHGGQDGFRCFKDASGGGICNSCGIFPDGFALLQWLRGWRFPEVLEAVARWLGGAPADGRQCRAPSPQPVIDAAEAQRRRARLQRAWKQALPLDHPRARPARAYLTRRGLPMAGYPVVLRCHPQLPYYENSRDPVGRFPALLSLVMDAAGQPVTLHRIYLTAHGDKAPVAEPKKLMPVPLDRRLSGGAIRLDPEGPAVLGVAEGLETALAVRLATGMPVWSAGSATLLEQVHLPASARQVVIWADLDHSGRGRQAAEVLAGRLAKEGRSTVLCLPGEPAPAGHKKLDWLDVLVRKGPGAVRSAWRP